ncbi:MAG: relaxase/mobilization nuclease domain-containing protein, partial [Geminicoccaceae bacterium]
MILKGNRRGGGMQMALHLLNAQDNEHVTIHEMRGFISDSLTEALTEAYAISRGTRCRKFLYSLSLNPPETEIVPVEVFETAINDIEKQLGFAGQPRAIVFHEKEGRRHAHCVWSRIDAA